MLHLDMINHKDFIDALGLDMPKVDENAPPINLRNHKRSIYFKCIRGGYKAQKGLEITDDLRSYFSSNSLNIFGTNNSLELFPMLEGKIPFHLLRTEADREIDISQKFHLRYFEKFKHVAPVPFPVALEVIDEKYQVEFLNALKNNISTPVFKRVESLLKSDSLCKLYYFHPEIPLRITDMLSERTLSQLLWNENKEFDVVEKWLELFSRMLILGFIPATKWSLITGNCLQPQNLCLYGGFADLDSLVGVNDINRKEVLYESLSYSMLSLTDSIFMALESNNSDSASKLERKWILQNYIFSEIKNRVLNNDTDSNIKQYFELKESFKTLRFIDK